LRGQKTKQEKNSMLTQDNLADLLNALGFNKSGAIHRKTFGDAVLEVNFTKKEISYPEAAGLVINERQTCNFEANENFVVLECVHRLLEKGYQPKHIELEPKWKLGRGASGGRADVLIKDNEGRPLLIIECKTAGIEFKRAWNKTLQDGDQLFSYAQQISETQFLCLYTSNLESGGLTYTSHIIAHRDNEKYLIDNPLFKNFKSVTDVKERHAVWRDTYKLDYTTKGIFEANIQPYHIGKDKYSLADLHAISAADQQKKYHEFATILRQHNVSGRENAFDKLVNLFLCKLVDEIENPSDLKFYWKGVAYDTHFEMMDRLQQLYQAGMGKFLGEDITYINQGDVKNALRFIRQNPDATQRAVWNLFIQQKFFTNNDFSLIDVHNEKLFYQNAEVLLKILQMWQDIRLTDPHGHNQFLGDMFEGFLDQGVKQSEGQFFTPMPICRFIMMSLPLASLIQRSATPPKAIDYACGAGHFLTELALQIKPLAQTHQPDTTLADYHRAMYGIEKEYRLSKVAKVSAFMYGQQEINICYGDALINQHEAFPAIKDGSFDLLVANPPYSVRGFLETLPEEERKAYTLLETINDLETSNSIETFFIERAKQLLRADGVAAIILPSSILSNGGSAYIRTREILIQYFDIVAIAEFGSGTFGKTGTNTVTLFLRRKKTAPDAATHYCERVEEWFKGCDASQRKQVIYKDEHLIEKYAAHIKVPLGDYKTLLKGDPNGTWAAHLEAIYLQKFNSSTEIANLYKAKWFKALTDDAREAEVNKRYLTFVQAIERDKLFHFVMASDQPNPVLIIRSPTDTKEQKKFLGYEWSSAKGGEGIKLIKDAHGNHLTPLYDETNRDNAEKLNGCIVANFDGKLPAIPADLQQMAQVASFIDMLDFTKAEFDKQLSLAPSIENTLITKWPLQPLVKIVDINPSSGNPVDLFADESFVYIDIASVEGKTGVVSYSQKMEPSEAPSRARRIVQNDDILLSTVRPNLQSFALLRNVPIKALASTGFAVLRVKQGIALPGFVYEMLFSDMLLQQMMAKMGKGQYPSINAADIELILCPLPSIFIQKIIVDELKVIYRNVDLARSCISSAQKDVDRIIDENQALTVKLSTVAALNPSKIELRHISDNVVVSFVDMASVSEKGFISRHSPRLLGNLRKGSYTYFSDDDIIVAKITPCMENGKCALALGLENGIGLGSTEFHVIRANQQKIIPAFLFALLNRESVRKKAEKFMTGASGHRRVPASFYENLDIPLPLPVEQKKFVAKIEALEKQIADAQAVIDGAVARKQAILQKYL
jgi:type I restriction-modification system DNA methylase subunit/restriction endonuclease S subunit